MSARVVAVTSLLVDVVVEANDREDLTPSEAALVDLLWHHIPDLVRINGLANREMRALAPAILAASEPTETLALPAS
jgi:hypothetical protein